MKSDRVFVYGTLMRGGRLHGEMKTIGAEFLGSGWIRAALFQIRGEWYPGAVPDESSRVWGEVYRVPKLESALHHLDEIEGVAGEGSFRRSLIDVRSGSRKFKAWTYFYADSLKGSKRLVSGRFRVPWDKQ